MNLKEDGLEVLTLTCSNRTSFSFLLFSLSVFSLDELLIFFLDLIELFHVLPEIFASLEGDQQLGSLHESWLVLFSFLTFLAILLVLVASGFLNFDGLGDEADIISVAIPYKLLGCNHADRGCVSKSMKYEVLMMLECLLAQIHIEGLILSV